ncbi:uncharacterized protein LOC119409038 [Nematolebias whitei]|uniref:uncharacterized protein LOC119409038 n=1 Tax=Nematolebias whitei TaxID=451745 RepID=UPI00189AB4D0|nr:uncharacterized protein LOC119409038 [Nematolebias whitei]
MQQAIINIELWARQWGFKFSVDKTKVIIFSKKQKTNKIIELKLYNQKIEQVKSIKFLGLWFDEKLKWNIHIQKIVDKCKRKLNILRCLVGNDWGAERQSLQQIYMGIIRSDIDYGCLVYSSAAKTHLDKLDSIQHQALRLCTGAFKTTPTAALEVETGEMPLDLRRTKLGINYWLNLMGNKEGHPTQEILKPCWEKEKKEMRSYGWKIEKDLKELKVDTLEISQSDPISVIPPWILPEAIVDLSIMAKKQEKSHVIDRFAVQLHLNSYYGHVQIYTDASKIDGRIGIAFTIPEFNVNIGKRVTDRLSIYTGELLAILLALQWIEDVKPLQAIICSDSSSALISIKYNNTDSRMDILLEIYHTLFRIQNMGLVVIFVWVPAHIGLVGNEKADKTAKKATHNPISFTVRMSNSEGKSKVKEELKKIWQRRWDEGLTGRWFYKIQKAVGRKRRGRRSRKEERIITRLRFGHTGLNYSLFKIQKHKNGKCEYCEKFETIEHVILECCKYEEERRCMLKECEGSKEKFNLIEFVRRDLGSRHIQIIIRYLKKTKLFHRI